MIHVPNWKVALAWYTKAFPEAVLVSTPNAQFGALQLGHFLIEIVESDQKVSSGESGTVLYWEVDDLLVAMEQFKELGSRTYRGPMQIENGMGMCQITDTFGNLIGLRGKFQLPSPST